MRIDVARSEGLLPPGDAFARVAVDGATGWAWLADGGVTLFDADVTAADLMAHGPGDRDAALAAGRQVAPSSASLAAPIDSTGEVWAAGVTYEQSREARESESVEPEIYRRVYGAERPELFFKSTGWRARGAEQTISIRTDSDWDVPEPELAAVLRPDGTVFGWTICNDVSSRSIEGANPLYLPQAKVYWGGCALGPAIVPVDAVPDPYALTITMSIDRDDAQIWTGNANTAQLHRRVDELGRFLFASDVFPSGVVLSTGTSLVPDPPFTLQAGDRVRIAIDGLGELRNTVVSGLPE